MIELHGISKTFAQNGKNSTSITPLDKVSLDIEDGKIIGLDKVRLFFFV